jgi:hypothetical protein
LKTSSAEDKNSPWEDVFDSLPGQRLTECGRMGEMQTGEKKENSALLGPKPNQLGARKTHLGGAVFVRIDCHYNNKRKHLKCSMQGYLCTGESKKYGIWHFEKLLFLCDIRRVSQIVDLSIRRIKIFKKTYYSVCDIFFNMMDNNIFLL